MKHIKSTIFLMVMAAVSAIRPAGAGELRIVGTGDGIEMLKALGESYTSDHPQTMIVVPPSIGSGGGIAAVGSDREMIARVARPLSDSEKSLGLIATPFVKLPSAFYVHRSVIVKNLSYDQLAKIYAGTITNWREVGGNDLRIKVVRREDADSTLVTLRQAMPGWKELVITEKSKTAVTTQDSIDSVRSTEGSIGFGPYAQGLEPELSVLTLDGKHPTNIGYSSSTIVALVHKESTISPDGKDFIRYVASQKARTLLTGLGGVPVF